MTDDWWNEFWWNELEPIEEQDRDEYIEKASDRIVEEYMRLWEEIEKRILADPESTKEIKRVANKYNEKEEIVLISMILQYFVKMGIISQRDVKDMFEGG